jgi:hypothetical protein
MSQRTTALDFSGLDDFRAAPLDPGVWSNNLAALSVEQPDLAEELRGARLPLAWRPALSLDDTATYRLEEPGAPATWLGGTAAPKTRAAALLTGFTPGDRNLALPTLGAGAELTFLLERLPVHLAVFAFEADLPALAAVLHLHDFSAAVTQGRCVFVPPGRAHEFLTRLMQTRTGLLPPGTILTPDLVPRARREELRTLCERMHGETNQRRARRLAELATAARRAVVAPTKTPRLALLALSADREPRVVAAGVTRAAQRLGWPVLCTSITGPHSVHPLVHCEALAEFQPTLTIHVNHARSVLPISFAGMNCVWYHHAANVPEQVPDDGTCYLAASPRVAEALRRAGARTDRVLPWYWACSPVDGAGPPAAPHEHAGGEAAQGGPAQSQTASGPILLVGDLPNRDPERYGVTQHSHRQLWEQIAAVVAQVWETPRVLEPEKLLVRAQGECGVELRDESLRASLARFTEQVIIPAVVLERLLRGLIRTGRAVLTVGHGWERLADGTFQPLAADTLELAERAPTLRPAACVLAGYSDPLSPALLLAAAAGWPVLMHSHGGAPLAPLLGDVLCPGQHFAPFRDLTELRRELQSPSLPLAARRTKRAREHVQLHHTYVCRLQDLAAHLSLPS